MIDSEKAKGQFFEIFSCKLTFWVSFSRFLPEN